MPQEDARKTMAEGNIYGSSRTTFPPGFSHEQSDASIASNKSSKVNDYGFSSAPAYQRQNPSAMSHNRSSAINNAGAWSYPGPEIGSQTGPHSQELIVDLEETHLEAPCLEEPYVEVSHLEDTPRTDNQTMRMGSIICSSNIRTKRGSDIHWLPISVLQDICQWPHVLRELQYSFSIEDASKYADYICGPPEQPKNEAQGSRRILAILTSISQISTLPIFVEAKLRDERLPFLWIGDSNELYSQSQGEKGEKKAISCFSQDQLLAQNFYKAQWQMLVPYISRDSHGEVKQYQLHKATMMPWTYRGKQIESGFSKVRYVEMHKDHHNFHDHKAFALKTLTENNPIVAAKDFESELKVFMKMRTQKHLLELCATFKFETEDDEALYSFLFPWAKGGSLTDLWDKQPHKMVPEKAVTPWLFLSWIAEQCHGLASALYSMHDLRQEALKKANQQEDKREDDDEFYGIHGDIKPENILHFSHVKDDDTGLGVLKLADFGLTDFHTLRYRTRTMKPHRNIPMPAPTYKAPEVVVPGEYMSRKIDIWALGCVFSQFMTWAICGPGSVKRFDDERKKERDIKSDKTERKMVQDTFFKSEEDSESRVKTTLKQSTKQASANLMLLNTIRYPLRLLTKFSQWLQDLQGKVQSNKGENFLTEFLSLILLEMLEVKRDERIGGEKLVEKLQKFVSKKQGPPDDAYWNPPLPLPLVASLATGVVLPVLTCTDMFRLPAQDGSIAGLGLDLNAGDELSALVAFARTCEEPNGADVNSSLGSLGSHDGGLFEELELLHMLQSQFMVGSPSLTPTHGHLDLTSPPCHLQGL
ncbi:hypothetical protein G7Z17_g790 [Cylindrodendrum hubeiense]|uniref:Protein kinase domain-containing protein n=1 Tax=Cylindrodendrum hubeiense TaxID=595255 RepID=A0A9P5HG45_9HYPO|nr:hypothetical protein G7Z17_g790 [Cylindrodendrum hubeiense]